MRMRKQRVMVAILAGGSTANVSLLQMAYQLPFVSGSPKFPWTFGLRIFDGIRPQEYARNIACKEFLGSDCDVLWMIDDDMIFEGDRTLDLLNTPGYDIAGPLQLMWDPGDPYEGKPASTHPCAAVRHAELAYKMVPVFPANGQRVLPVDMVGSGCIAIQRRVLEDKAMLLDPNQDPPAFWRNVYRPNGERLRGLDADFCYRAKDLGYRVLANYNASIGHFKRVDLNRVEAYAKALWIAGHEKGTRDAVPMAEGEGRQEA